MPLGIRFGRGAPAKRSKSDTSNRKKAKNVSKRNNITSDKSPSNKTAKTEEDSSTNSSTKSNRAVQQPDESIEITAAMANTDTTAQATTSPSNQNYSSAFDTPADPNTQPDESMTRLERLWQNAVASFWVTDDTLSPLGCISQAWQEACISPCGRTSAVADGDDALVDVATTALIQSKDVLTAEDDEDDDIPSDPAERLLDTSERPKKQATSGKHQKTPRHKKKKKSHSSSSSKKQQQSIPLLEVQTDQAATLERSISELTMRSSYATAMATASSSSKNTPTNKLRHLPAMERRMAYYAVGKYHHKGRSNAGGNRRCYFTGKLILGPFYAGSVQQGLRTLVVFCLPSAVGLPDQDALKRYTDTRSKTSKKGTILSVQPVSSTKSSSNRSTGSLHMDTQRGILLRSSGRSADTKSLASKLSRWSNSLDDLSLSIEGDLDPNWGLDRHVLLAVLPEAGADLLKQMADHYPEQFETLPLQVRDAGVWKLYIKFCFFSGLPIAQGELHYKVLDDIAEQTFGEEIALSHAVLEAATGSSADILALPNRIVLQYLQKHYPQQCGKLEDRVFVRSSWERVAPEV